MIVKPLSVYEARYLKHMGQFQDCKVTLINATTIHIRDFVYHSFEDAIDFLKWDSQFLVSEKSPEDL